MTYTILVVNLGGTSTKVALYENDESIAVETLRHPTEIIMQPFHEQIEFRFKAIMSFLEQCDVDPQDIDIVSARGGVLKPIQGGTYDISREMVEDLRENRHGQHASNMSGVIADRFRARYGCQAVITDPVVVDELIDEVRPTGLRGIERRSVFHALNQKAVARKYAESINKSYSDINAIVCHMGGGITVGAHRHGKVIDVNDGLSGEGPMSPTRTGSLPNDRLARYILENDMDYDSVYDVLTKEGGFISLAGTQDAIELEERALAGDGAIEAIFRALAAQVAKEIGSRAAILKGDVDQIIFTGGLAYSQYLMDLIIPYISFIAPVAVYAGEAEMQALAEGAYRVLTGQEEMKTYV
ncbi:butyrate kinase [Salinicoccus cyprini]|uniref:Probable butyrate kinase n=1 Tax=Salinicoccus cyprini TaxID=2493691 RepID=A0A558AZ39_9STAP|nr:butyrate kinase [Salinicoccus cyprini]TVT29497.1 butyrate kinase [Salinicoccus cyprini]